MVDKILDFILDMKNILSIGALGVFIGCVASGLISGDDAFTVIMMTFTFFLGSKVNKSE